MIQFVGAKLKSVFDGWIVHGLLSDRCVFAWLSVWVRLLLRRKRPCVIGITGSVGKSTVTEVLYGVLSHPLARPALGRVERTVRNMNNRNGLPLVILGLDDWHESLPARFRLLLIAPLLCLRRLWGPFPKLFVLEYGTDRSGYLAPLVALTPPDITIITAIGPAHLEGMKTLAGIAEEKGTLIRGMRTPGLVVLGAGHAYVEQLESYAANPVVRVEGRGAELAARIARVVANYLKVPPEAVEVGLAVARGPERRLDRFEAGPITIIDDSYNANPLSLALGLDTLMEAAAGRRRVAIIGNMAELGELSKQYHEELGVYARRCADFVVGVGALAVDYRPDRHFADSGQCVEALNEFIAAGDTILIKGSASVGMKVIVEALRARWASSPPTTPSA